MRCKECFKEVSGSGVTFCSAACKEISAQRKANEIFLKRSKELKGIENIDYVVCKWCNSRVKRIYGIHIKNHHPGKTATDYKTEFPGSQLTSENDKRSTSKNSGLHMKEDKYRKIASEKIRGNKNPNHRSKVSSDTRKTRSPFSQDFVSYKNAIDKEAAVKEFVKIALRDRLTETQLEYWLEKFDSDEEKASAAYKERQRTFTLKKCISKYGKDVGTKRWKERQLKWHTSYKKINYSKISQELFVAIHEMIKDNYKEDDIFYATLVKNKDGKNHEYVLDLNDRIIRPDFFIKSEKKIIEFDGTYYHRNTTENKKREAERDKAIIEGGYTVLHITESDYKKDPNSTIERCLNFIYDKDS